MLASVLATEGTSLLVIGRILGYRVPATTARYAHLSDDPVRAAAELAGQRIATAMMRGPVAEVVPISAGARSRGVVEISPRSLEAASRRGRITEGSRGVGASRGSHRRG